VGDEVRKGVNDEVGVDIKLIVPTSASQAIIPTPTLKIKQAFGGYSHFGFLLLTKNRKTECFLKTTYFSLLHTSFDFFFMLCLQSKDMESKRSKESYQRIRAFLADIPL